MCIPKRTPSQQRTHEATMRAINRGKRNHPRHHNNFRPVYLIACIACALFAAALIAAAAFFMQPGSAAAFSASGPLPPGPGAGTGASGSQSVPPVAPNPLRRREAELPGRPTI